MPTDSLGRTLDNFGKDIRTIVSIGVGVGNSAEVYAVIVIRPLSFVICEERMTTDTVST